MMLLAVLVSIAALSEVGLSEELNCSPSASECEFWLEVEERLVMQKDQQLLAPFQGKMYLNASRKEVVTDGYIQADGWNINTRMVMVVNKTMPGPAIKVYENQMVTVHVHNLFESETLSIHWHGIHQSSSPYMDGVPFVSQCPILPGQTFTYRFKAYPVGTHWYHSHSGAQRTNGVHGAFIVYPKSSEPMTNEHIMVLSDWVHDYESMTGHLKMNYGLYINEIKYQPTSSLDGSMFSLLQFQSGLINGKGRYWTSATANNGAPLHQFKVVPGTTYRFRVIGAGALYPFRVSVDSHPLTVVATDGFAIRPLVVQSFVINPGERVDFTITTSMPISNYFIVAETLESGTTYPHFAEAILSYEGSPEIAATEKPRLRPTFCSATNKCKVLNCPFIDFPQPSDVTCLHYADLNSNVASENPEAPGGDYEEFFLNFAFPGHGAMPGSVNGRRFVGPTSLAYSSRNGFTSCSPKDCGPNQSCRCTYTIDMQFGKTYQLTFLNVGQGRGWGHPVHLHGHSFYVLKTVFGVPNVTSGKLDDTPEIDCHGDEFCNNASWSANHQPQLNLTRAIQKDTIIVPTGGYVIVRIKADNPGVWLMHCHIDMHHMDGMAMLVDSGSDRRPSLPAGFPECDPYNSQAITSRESIQQQLRTAIAVGASVGSVLLITVTVLVVILVRKRREEAVRGK